MATGHTDRVREPSGGRGHRATGTPAPRRITTQRGRQIPTARQNQGTEGRPGDSRDRGSGGLFRPGGFSQPNP